MACLPEQDLKSPVVWYNNDALIGIRIRSIPVEDIFYGMALILLNLIIYRYLIQNKIITRSAAMKYLNSKMN